MIVLTALLAGCSNCDKGAGCQVGDALAGGLLSVRTPAPDDVWVVGASADPADGSGPIATSYDGETWSRLDTSAWDGSELWWVWVTADEAVLVGNDGLILEHDRSSGAIAAVEGPDAATTFFGVWGASADDLWAVGQTEGGSGTPALYRRQGGTWAPFVDPALGEGSPGQIYFKVHGTAADDVWIVGSDGIALHWDGTALTRSQTGITGPLLTVDAGGERPIAVGGSGNGVLLEYDGTAWIDRSPPFQPGLNGVCTGSGAAWTVGQSGARAKLVDGTWTTDADQDVERLTRLDWHACSIDSDGGLWTVGGRIASRPLNDGIIGYQGPDRPKPVEGL